MGGKRVIEEDEERFWAEGGWIVQKEVCWICVGGQGGVGLQ